METVLTIAEQWRQPHGEMTNGPVHGVILSRTAMSQASSANDALIAATADVLAALGENLDREGLRRTPQRMARALAYLTGGATMTMKDVLNGAIFTERYDQMVLVKDIEFYSPCEHHVLPFHGRAGRADTVAGAVRRQEASWTLTSQEEREALNS